MPPSIGRAPQRRESPATSRRPLPAPAASAGSNRGPRFRTAVRTVSPSTLHASEIGASKAPWRTALETTSLATSVTVSMSGGSVARAAVDQRNERASLGAWGSGRSTVADSTGSNDHASAPINAALPAGKGLNRLDSEALRFSRPASGGRAGSHLPGCSAGRGFSQRRPSPRFQVRFAAGCSSKEPLDLGSS
jgi:hypothetical protein